jgi:hypothetical protein
MGRRVWVGMVGCDQTRGDERSFARLMTTAGTEDW